MSFWKRIFGKKTVQQPENREVTSPSKKEEARQEATATLEELEQLLQPLIRKTTVMKLHRSSVQSGNTQLQSHFRGQPYFEEGEEWPSSKSGWPMDFIFQVFNQPDFPIPEDIQLIQFFYDWEEFPWDTENDGWLVKIYKKLDQDKRVLVNRPAGVDPADICEIVFKPGQSLPDWEGSDVYSKEAADLACAMNEDAPWEIYEQAVTKLVGEQEYQSQLGGYPKWVQGESTPTNSKGQLMKLLFQIDSEEVAGLMWGDVGLIYVFYDEATEEIGFSLQCH